MKDLKYQQDAIRELTEKTVKVLNSGGSRTKIVFEAPTGAGKTVMACQTLSNIVDELKNRGDSIYEDCAFIWFAPRKLHLQSYKSLKNAFGESRKLSPVMFDEIDQSEGIQPGEILFVNWESINKDTNRMAKESESSASLYEITRKTQEELGLPIVAIIDEEHMFWSKTADKSAKVLDKINPAVEIRISATPKTAINGTTQKVLVDRRDVIKAEMIKKEVVLNLDIDVDASDPLSLEERLLKVALRKRQQIAEEYERLGINIKPLLLVQLPNDTSDRLTEEDETIYEIVKTYLGLNSDEVMTVENGKLAIWLANEKENLEGLEKPDNLAKVLLFKEAIALGWDCPRAAVLLIFRKLSSDQFTVQTVGRIMRMPEQRHYPKDLLNIGYVYTDISKDKIKIVAADQNYILNDTIPAVRRENLHNISLPAVYASRPNIMHNYLGPDYKKVLYETAEELFCLSGGGGLFSLEELASLHSDDDKPLPLPETGDLEIDENRKKAAEKIRLDVKTVNIEIPKDVHFQNEIQELEVEKARFARTAGETDRVYIAFINKFGHQFESRQGDRTKRIAEYLLSLLEDFFGLYYTDAKKVVLYHENRNVFSRLLELSLERYLRLRKKERPSDPRIFTEYNWEVPEERIYDSTTNHIEKAEDHALTPFVQLNNASMPEKEFVKFLESNSQYIDWWYKNGDSGKQNYAIEYLKGSEKEKALFYVDFVIRLKNGHIYLFDTKSHGSDIFAAEKHNALLEYIKHNSTSSQPLFGGVIVHQGDNWLFSPLPIANTTDTLNWDIFNPKNA